MRKRWILLGAVLAMVAAGCGDSADTVWPSSTTTAAPTTAAPTTTAPTTTTPETTSTTTTAPPPPPEVVFNPDSIGFAGFGEDPQAVIAMATSLWGPPASDTGLLPSHPDFCPGTQYRKVMWTLSGYGPVTLLFTDDEPWSTGGEIVFTGYGYRSFELVRLTAGPPASIDVGVTVAEALAMWPQGHVEESEMTGELMFWYTPGWPTGILLTGLVSGLDPSDVLLTIWGGRGCYGDEPGAD